MATLKEEAARFEPVDLAKLREAENVTDAMRAACGLYNSALSDIAAGSYSSARSSLRKATVLCPEFNYAVILYGICTFCGGDRTGALRIFNSVRSPKERSRAMRLYDRLVDEELSVSAAEVSGARLRKSIESFSDGHVDSVYKKRPEREYEEEVITQPQSLFIDGEAGGPVSSVRVSTGSWAVRDDDNDTSGTDNVESSRKKAVVTVRQIPETGEKKKRVIGGNLIVIIIIVLLIALLISIIGWVAERARRRTEEQKKAADAVAQVNVESDSFDHSAERPFVYL